MANKGYVDALLNSLEPALKQALKPAFEHVLTWAALGDQTKATNFGWYRLSSTTAATAGEEFSVLHGLDVAPSKLIPVLDLTAVGSQLVPLTVSRAPDSKRVYLTSASTSAVFLAYVE